MHMSHWCTNGQSLVGIPMTHTYRRRICVTRVRCVTWLSGMNESLVYQPMTHMNDCQMCDMTEWNEWLVDQWLIHTTIIDLPTNGLIWVIGHLIWMTHSYHSVMSHIWHVSHRSFCDMYESLVYQPMTDRWYTNDWPTNGHQCHVLPPYFLLLLHISSSSSLEDRSATSLMFLFLMF